MSSVLTAKFWNHLQYHSAVTRYPNWQLLWVYWMQDQHHFHVGPNGHHLMSFDENPTSLQLHLRGVTTVLDKIGTVFIKTNWTSLVFCEKPMLIFRMSNNTKNSSLCQTSTILIQEQLDTHKMFLVKTQCFIAFPFQRISDGKILMVVLLVARLATFSFWTNYTPCLRLKTPSQHIFQE